MAAVIRSGATAGTRVWMRMTFTCPIAASARIAAPSVAGGSTSGSPPVRMTSQMPGFSPI